MPEPSTNGGEESPKAEEAKPPPKAVVNRLSLYLRELQRLVRDDHATISSSQLGKLLGFTDAQVRKDLAYFGQFGHPGVGYRCDDRPRSEVDPAQFDGDATPYGFCVNPTCD